MKINIETGEPFTILELSSIAREYFDAYRSKQLQAGFSMCIATNGYDVMFVDDAYLPSDDDEVVFLCDVRSGADARDGFTRGTGVHLYRTYYDEQDEAKQRKLDFFKTVPKFHVKQNMIFYCGKVYRQETPEQRRERKMGPKKYQAFVSGKRSKAAHDNDNDNDNGVRS